MAGASSSSVPVGPARQLTTPEYSNWLALGHALTTILCQGLRPFIKQEMKTLYTSVTATIAALSAGPCTCVYAASRKPNQYHDMTYCAWAGILQAHHRKNKPNWKQSDSSKWTDPNLGPWEIAKLYLPDLSRNSVVNSADHMDITGILNLMYWCNHFIVPQPLVDAVREIRNTKWAHVPKLELTDVDKKAAFDAIEKLLEDPQIAHDPDVQKALQEILKLECVSDLQTFEAQVLIQHREVTEKDISSLKNELNTLKKESKRNTKQRSQLEGRLHNMQRVLEHVNDRMNARITLTSIVKNGVLCTWYYLIRCSKGTRGTLLTPWLIILLLCDCFTTLDPRSFKDASLDRYQSIGCFQDHNNRAIPTLEGHDSILDGSYSARLDPIEKCYRAAKKRGFHVFAVQNGGWCASSGSAAETLNKYGKSSACKSDGEGGPWANQVYYIKGYRTVGCYKDTSNRAIQTLEGKDSILDGSYTSRANPITKCAMAAMRAGYSMFAVQNGGWCAASATAPQTFDKYGKSTACKLDGEGGPWANQVYVVKLSASFVPYETIGCFQDNNNRAIPTLEGQDSILDGSYSTRLDSVEKCYRAAKKRGFHVFGVQNGGWCASSALAAKTFNKYGKSSVCPSDGEGGPWANQVYYIKEYEAIGCYKDTSNRAIQTLEGKDSILDGSYTSRTNPIAKCAVAAMRAGYSMFAVQDGGWCAASATTPQTFDKYGKSTACMADGEGGPWANEVYLMKSYETVGCYKDTSNRAIHTLEGKDSILDGSYTSRTNPIAKCAVAAMRAGYSMFAVQNGGWCAASATASETFDKFGKSTACMADGEGGPWANNIYLIRDCNAVGCYNNTSNQPVQTLKGKDSILDGSYSKYSIFNETF